MNLLFAQILVILGLFITGFVLANLILHKENIALIAVVSYPVGVAFFGFVGMFMLIAGIEYNLLSISIAYVVLFGFTVWGRIKSSVKCNYKFGKNHMIIILVVLIIAFISASGIIKVGISNDSLYYYSLYPQTIVIDGGIELSYDVFLTDVGQVVAIINTLPFLFGFNEAYGILIAMLFSFVAFFIYFVYERMVEVLTKPRVVVGNGIKKYIAENSSFCIKFGTVISALILVTCTPFLVMSRWVLANAYVMEYMFIIFGLVYIAQKENNSDLLWIVALFIACLTMMRMEGGLMAGLLIICVSIYEISNERLTIFFVIPSLVFIIPYYVVLYLKLGVNPEYSFLNMKNALLQIGFLIVIGIYIIFMRGRNWFKIIDNYFPYIVIIALGMVNIVLFAYDYNKYFENISAFFNNIVLGNGWGYFGFFVVLMLMLISKNRGFSANSLFCISYILMCVAILFARNGALRVGSGDSGNRVLMQIVPFVIYTLVDEILGDFNDGE